MEKHCTSHILMIRPVNFGFNPDAAQSNAFMEKLEIRENPQENALLYFDHFVEKLRSNGVNVYVVDDTPEPFTPDSIFPNNWVSFHADGKVVLYPMEPQNRRGERRIKIIEDLSRDFKVNEIIDLSFFENSNHFLEGTGSMVLDRINKVAYVCLSSRSHEVVLDHWQTHFPDYETVRFEGVDRHGIPIYHTNVMLCIGEDFAIICADALKTPTDRERVFDKLEKTGKTILEITFSQMEHFAGNMLQIENNSEEKLLVMSEVAFNSLNQEQRAFLSYRNKLIMAELGLIETLGGGSARCMLTEIHLPF